MWNKAGRIGPADDVMLDDAPRTNASVEQKKQSITSRPAKSQAPTMQQEEIPKVPCSTISPVLQPRLS